jgi:hypothetical protein
MRQWRQRLVQQPGGCSAARSSPAALAEHARAPVPPRPLAEAHLKHTQTAKSGEPSPCCIATAVATDAQSEECDEGMPPESKNDRRLNTPVL